MDWKKVVRRYCKWILHRKCLCRYWVNSMSFLIEKIYQPFKTYPLCTFTFRSLSQHFFMPMCWWLGRKSSVRTIPMLNKINVIFWILYRKWWYQCVWIWFRQFWRSSGIMRWIFTHEHHWDCLFCHCSSLSKYHIGKQL